jgi:NAD(P)-dependent dehydrogenase (short-subunit alcohol dehydrogenase family)
MKDLFDLSGKTALITGAAQGIGEAIAELFTDFGARCVITDINDTLGQALAARLEGARYIHLDVQEETHWQSAMAELGKAGQTLDIVVNNAAVIGFVEGYGLQDPEHASLEDWQRVHRINLDGVFLGCKYAIAAMKERGGSIVNMSSRSGLVGIPGAAAYASSKAAVRNHTKSVALHCASQDYMIRCNSIHPAAILTPMWDPMLGEGELREAAMSAIVRDCPMKRFGQPIDVAYAALYLASEASSYVTGIELNLDGGILAGSAAAPGKE